MASLSVAVQILLALLQCNISYGDVNGLTVTGTEDFPVSFEDDKELQTGITKLGFKTNGKWKLVCENEILSLACNAGEIINIMDAEYGRNDRTTCASYPDFNTSCLSHSDALYTLKQRCQNKRKCSMKLSIEEFGDPCPNFIKYLKVKYSCEQVRSAIRESVTLCETLSQIISCPKRTSIMITDAFYGRNDKVTCCCHLMNNTKCMAKNVLEILSARCDYNEQCTVQADNKYFGDPCFGTTKYLTVDYLCLPGKVQHARRCETWEIKLGCEKNSFIDVIDAHYGRAHPFICTNDVQPLLKKNCASKDITSSVKERCQGKNLCAFPASNGIFGDPCIGYTKYLDVDYSCVATG